MITDGDNIANIAHMLFAPRTKAETIKHFLPINPLAIPKHQKIRVCYMCPKYAYLLCSNCQLISYCSYEHMDKDDVHHQVCDHLAYIYMKRPFIPDTEKQLRLDYQTRFNKQVVARKLRNIAYQFQRKGNHSQGKLACKYSSRLYQEALGEYHPNTLESFLLLATFCSELHDFDECEAYIAKVDLHTVGTTGQSHLQRAGLCQVRGMMEAAKGNLEEALFNHVEEVYIAVHVHGTDSVLVAASYWRLGRSFFYLNRRDITDSLYRQCTDIWLSYLQVKLAECEHPMYERRLTHEKVEIMSPRMKTDGSIVLRGIYRARIKHWIQSRLDDMVKAYYTLAMFFFLYENYSKAHDMMLHVMAITKRMEESELTSSCYTFYKQCRSKLPFKKHYKPSPLGSNPSLISM